MLGALPSLRITAGEAEGPATFRVGDGLRFFTASFAVDFSSALCCAGASACVAPGCVEAGGATVLVTGADAVVMLGVATVRFRNIFGNATTPTIISAATNTGTA